MRNFLVCVTLGAVSWATVAQAQEDTSAFKECGKDRRCRIARMKRMNEERRWREMRRADEDTQRFQEARKQRERDKVLRRKTPIFVSFLATMLGPGLAGGYMLNDVLRLEGRFASQPRASASADIDVNGTKVSISGDAEGMFFGLGGAYIFRKDWWSPYVAGEVLYGTGLFDPYFFDNNQGFQGGSRVDTEFHVVGLSAGFDLQWEVGLRARFGAMLRQPIFAIARSGKIKDATNTKAVRAWFETTQRIGFEFGVGWSF